MASIEFMKETLLVIFWKWWLKEELEIEEGRFKIGIEKGK